MKKKFINLVYVLCFAFSIVNASEKENKFLNWMIAEKEILDSKLEPFSNEKFDIRNPESAFLSNYYFYLHGRQFTFQECIEMYKKYLNYQSKN